ncbi:glycoside hydrolase family 18 protein [Teratosphaeria destructans]|uniref:chitinase n=1 Tax=Teratosphaeria destructans TaxID=418781 RepID=A0A9W7SPE9_9PEZI|nr:glycoside hydrolase family 18 protein [Teratosphaeria destructans]
MRSSFMNSIGGSALALFCLQVAAVDIHEQHAALHRHVHRSAQQPQTYGGHADQGAKALAYYGNWFIYARNFNVSEIPASKLTHILYAFANINNETGEVYLSDEFADVQKPFEGDHPVANDTNLYGNLKQLYLLKKGNRHLKTMLSIGGWTYRKNFDNITKTDQGRRTFAKSSVQLLKDCGFDGIDLDWEYPDGAVNSENVVKLLQEVRKELDNYSQNLTGNPHFSLTGAWPAGPQNYQWLKYQELDQYLDFWYLMAYDYMGPGFSNFTGHQANVYNSTQIPRSTDYETNQAVEAYINGGVPPEKIVLGMPLYGREFQHTTGLGQPFNGTGPGTWEAGVYDYKDLPFPNSSVKYDPNVIASWSYTPSRNNSLVSYDTPECAIDKVKYLQSKGLGGAGWWEISADRPCDQSDSLIKVVTDRLGPLDMTANVLDYPYSKYANLRHGMGNETLCGTCPV